MADDIRSQENLGRGKTVSTPEGDNEYAPEQPLTPATVDSDADGLQRWPTNSGMEWDKKQPAPEEHPEHHAGLRQVIDEISTGKLLP